jgi:transcriptional regulator with XRE-family HTH domain
MDKLILDKIKQVRVLTGISARRLGVLSGLSVTSISNFEHGNIPSMKNLAKILVALELPINEKMFTRLLKNKRKDLSATLDKVGRIAGLSHTIIHKAERGILPSIKSCCIIAKELDLPFDKIIKWPKKLNKPL